MLRVTHVRGPRTGAADECVFTPVYVGTAQGCDVAFPHGSDPNIGTHHAEIHFNQGALYIVNRGTATGTYVQGARVTQQLLSKGDTVSFGHPQGTSVQLELVSPLVPRPHGVQTDADGRVDVATAQQLVADAVRHATAQPDNTAALVAGKVHKATRRSSRVLALLSVGVVLSLLATIVAFAYVYRSQQATDVLASEVGLGETEDEPEGDIPDEVLSGKEIYEKNKYALYVIGYIDGKRVGGCCTAFAISSKILATNAHCISSCVERDGDPVVIQNEGSGRVRFDIVGTEIHPRYRDDEKRSNTPDVALIKVRGKMPKKVTLASEAELLSIGPGDDAYVLGFPGRVIDPSNPVATFLKGSVGRTTNLDGESVSAKNASLIQHNAVTRGGNSGSPIFNQHGNVIAIHTAHIDAEEVVRISGKKTKVVDSSPFRLGMRIDLLKKVPAPVIRVVHTFGARAGAVNQVPKTVVRFGRAPDNDVVFDPNHDRDAGSYHAEVRADGGMWFAVDLQSKNGLFLRGRRVAREALQHGDELVFGANGPRVRIEFEAQAQATPGAAPALTPPPAAAPAVTPHPAAPHPAAPHPAAPHQANPYQAAAQPAVAHAPPPQAAHHAPAAVAAAAAAAAPPPAAGAPAAGGKRVGKKTMAFMIGSAVQAATRRPRTQEIKMMVDQKVDQTSKGHRRRAYVLGFLVLVALSALGLIIAWGVQSQDDIQELREDLAELPPEDPRRKDIESRLGELHPSNANFGRNLYDKYQKGIFMLAARGQGFCTAFAIKKNVLATNAHCVKAAERAGGTITAVENEGRGKVKFRVKSMKAHPGYRPNDATRITQDVGIVKIDGKAAVVLSRAKKSELKKSGAGEEIYLIGFPGRLMDADNPAATFLSANIGRVTKPDGKPGGFSSTWLVQHDAVTTKGTSGSPIFNGRGKVIAINAGGYLEGDDQTIAGRKTEVVKASPYKFGMRIDLLDKIL